MNIRSTALRQFCRFSVQCALLNLVFAVTAHAADVAGQLTVKEFAGAVKVKMDDRWLDPEVGMAVVIPATVSTGADGSIELVQDGTVVSVAANTALELLPGLEAGQFVKRIVQSKGSTFYDVSKREHDKLRVETPYLVAVIKGTQFNVTVEAESTSVALFEGRLQIEAPDVGDTVDLQAGHIAKRHKGDARITVLRMDDGEPVSRNTSEPGPAHTGGSGNPALTAGEGDMDNADVVAEGVTTSAGEQETPFVVNPEIDLGGGEAATALGAGLDGGKAGFGIDVSDDLKIDSGNLDLETATAIDIADAGVDVGIGADVDLGTGDIGADIDAGVDVADAGVDVGADVAADLGAGDIGADIGVGDLGVGAGVDTGVDGSGGGLDVDLDLGQLDGVTDVVDGLLGGADVDPAPEEEEEEEPAPLLPDLGNLLGL